jgi:serine/threonine protein kinase
VKCERANEAAREWKDKRAQEEREREFEALKKALALLKELREAPIVPPPVPPPVPPALPHTKELGPGTIFADRFELRRELGRGGMSVVWLAGDRRLDRDVTLKFLPDSIAHDKVAADDLRKETCQSIELSHPHIGRVYDFVEAEGRVAISMEYINGQTLSELRLQKPHQIFETRELEAWVKELCEALEYAHKRAMLTHCDINPSNLMVNTRGHL